MTQQPLKVGLIGYGFAGRVFHAPVLTSVPELLLTKVVERSSETSKERYPYVEVVKSVQSLYDDPDMDLIVVATPSTDHYTFAKEALLAGKHVIVEKPFTATSAEADELVELARRQGKVISVFHNRRWDGDYQTVRQVLRSGCLGRLSEAEFRWDRFSPHVTSRRWRDAGEKLGSGVFYDLGVHLIDQALCLFGKPETITADIRTQRDGAGADDGFEVTLGYPDRLKVRLRASLLARQPGPRYSLYGTNGSFVKYGEDPQEEELKAGRSPLDADYGIEREERYGKLDTVMDGLRFIGSVQTLPGGYQHYYRNVAEHILGRAELEVKPEEARDAIRLIELGLISSKDGRTVQVTW
ncbi:oxidoreductase [Paenibacillus nanensis]|uniref:Oxidoreductase n=1 Tax=Paenibacillus nanensis TaxID=393251 RepID=A0A3A1UQY3_9BACL|nr:oxidoreductase [Paenibacillus nanensis]RIX50216.1 oxidoreductase [Paenibacillus nanensis]